MSSTASKGRLYLGRSNMRSAIYAATASDSNGGIQLYYVGKFADTPCAMRTWSIGLHDSWEIVSFCDLWWPTMATSTAIAAALDGVAVAADFRQLNGQVGRERGKLRILRHQFAPEHGLTSGILWRDGLAMDVGAAAPGWSAATVASRESARGVLADWRQRVSEGRTGDARMIEAIRVAKGGVA